MTINLSILKLFVDTEPVVANCLFHIEYVQGYFLDGFSILCIDANQKHMAWVVGEGDTPPFLKNSAKKIVGTMYLQYLFFFIQKWAHRLGWGVKM